MGAYGPLKGMPDGTMWDKLFHNSAYFVERVRTFPLGYRVVRRGSPGVLGFTNAIVRKELWELHHFDESYGAGGEDGEWAAYWLDRGYVIIKDMEFAVHHSHYLNLKQWIAQFRHWSALTSPQPFSYLPYRRDGAHRKN